VDLHRGRNLTEFYKTPTRLAIFSLLVLWLGIAASFGPAAAEERVPLMDLQRGGPEFFDQMVPSIVQVYNGGINLEEQGGAGSGYVIDREGHCITNKHVTDQAPVLEIALFENHEDSRAYHQARYLGELVAEDPALDLAIIKINAPAENFYPLRLADSAEVLPGDTVATFGSPGGDPGWVDRSRPAFQDSWLEFYNMNLGIISEVLTFEESFWAYRDVFTQNYVDFLSRVGPRDYGSAVEYLFHTDAAINHGNSGGPCLNVYGEAVGTNTWGFPGENMGFSVPVNLLKKSVTDILEYGHVRRPWCGIALHPQRTGRREFESSWANETMQYTGTVWFDTTPDELIVYTVNPYSPAYEAGLRDNDIIKKIDGQEWENIFDVYSYFMSMDVDDVIVIEAVRNDSPLRPMRITLVEKQTRYFGTNIEATAFGNNASGITRYSADITY